MAMASSSSSSADPPPSLNPHHPISNPTHPPLSCNPSKPSFPASATSPSPPLYIPAKSPNPPPTSKIQETHLISHLPQGIAFPVAASSSGFPPKTIKPSSQPSDQLVTVANPIGYPIPSGRSPAVVGFQRPIGFNSQSVYTMRPPSAQSPYVVTARQMGSLNSGALRGVPAVALHPKVAQLPIMSSSSDYNHYKDLRDKSRDDAVVTIHDRKVRLSDAGSGSLYTLCRSWVRNGSPQENQPQIGDGIKLLPRPLPTTMADTRTSKRGECDAEDDFWSKEESNGSVENLSAHDLLEGHIKRAKKVRARLREERLQRIDRYRQRLSLLLPPPPMDQCRNDAATSS